MGQIGTIVIDELHFVTEPDRGFLLEVLLTKILLYERLKKRRRGELQIIGLSATLPNLETVARWLGARLFTSVFRPVPLGYKLKYGRAVYSWTEEEVAYGVTFSNTHFIIHSFFRVCPSMLVQYVNVCHSV